MAYTKNPTWTETTPIIPEKLNKLETQYDEAKIYVDEHEAKSAPHAGHALKTDLDSHKTDANAHTGYLVSISTFNNHVNAVAPHSGHVTTSHLSDANAHNGVLVKVSTFDAHVNATAPHSGHATVTAFNAHTSAEAPHTGHVKGNMRITVAVATSPPTSPAIGDIWIIS